MTLELFLGLIVLAVLVVGGWALFTVFRQMWVDDDTLEEVESESAYREALRRLQ